MVALMSGHSFAPLAAHPALRKPGSRSYSLDRKRFTSGARPLVSGGRAGWAAGFGPAGAGRGRPGPAGRAARRGRQPLLRTSLRAARHLLLAAALPGPVAAQQPAPTEPAPTAAPQWPGLVRGPFGLRNNLPVVQATVERVLWQFHSRHRGRSDPAQPTLLCGPAGYRAHRGRGHGRAHANRDVPRPPLGLAGPYPDRRTPDHHGPYAPGGRPPAEAAGGRLAGSLRRYAGIMPTG